MDNLPLNIQIFSKSITPIQTYMLIGDRNPEIEIKSSYLYKLLNKEKKSTENNISSNSINNSLLNSVERKKTTKKNFLTESPKKKNTSSINPEIKIIIKGNSDLDISNDKISNNFLSNLHDLGEYSDKNVNLIELSTEQKNYFKLENNNPFISSFNKLNRFSIFYGTNYNKLIKKNNELMLPEPYYIENNKWCIYDDNSLSVLWEGVKVVDNSGIVIDSPDLKKKFSGIVRDIIIQLLKVPFGHHISLNIKIFEPNTVLSRYSRIFSLANTFLIPASDSKIKPYERFKYIIAFLFGSLYTSGKQLKPFNPFLGETFEGEFQNGAKIYVENVTHKPLVARFLIIYKKIYEISGYWDLQVQSSPLGNEMIIHQKGPIRIKFPELNENFVGHIPFIKATNAKSEEKRAMLFFGSLICVDTKHNYKAFIEFDFNKKIFHEIRGCTMIYEFPLDYKYDANKEWDFGLKFKMENDININKKKTKMNNNYTIYEKISGSFLHYLKIGEDVVWDIQKHPAEPIKPVNYCIPSDGRYREDLIWLYRSFYGKKDEKEEEIYREIGMKWKIMMEEFNRWERKHRADYKEILKKKNKI